MKKLIEVSNLKKDYPSFSLNNVSFIVKENSITGFVGINGAGKTTTIKALFGLIKRNGGKIKILGLDIDDPKNNKYIRNKVGLVMDKNYYYDHFSIKKMKDFLAASYSEWNDDIFYEYLLRLKLDENQTINQLSRGMKIKLSLAIAFSHNADLLIMDEPTSGLDPIMRSSIIQMLDTFSKKKGKGVLFSTHICSDLEKVADNILVIHNGKIVLDESKSSILKNYYIITGPSDQLPDRTSLECYNISDAHYMAVRKREHPPKTAAHSSTLEELLLPFMNGGKSYD